MKFNSTLTNVVVKIMKTGRVPMLLGEPGIGKSSWTEALAEAMHTKCFTLACNQLADKADLTGARLVPITEEKAQPDGSTVTTTVGYKQVFYPHAVVMDAVLYAKKHKRETPILFLDELNRTTSDITSELLSIPTMRKLGDVELPPNLKVLTAGNDKGNITTLDSASISRFFLVHVDPDTSTFLSLDPNLNKFVRSVLEAHPECIFCKEITQISTDDDDDGETTSPAVPDKKSVSVTYKAALGGLPDGKIHISTRSAVFDRDTEIRLTGTGKADDSALKALRELGLGKHDHYAFDISLYDSAANKRMNTLTGGHIEFAIPVPKKLLSAVDDLDVYHISGGRAQRINSSIAFTNGQYRIEFSASDFSTYMIVDMTGELADFTQASIADTSGTGSGLNPHTGVTAAVTVPAALVGCALLSRKIIKKRKRTKTYVE